MPLEQHIIAMCIVEDQQIDDFNLLCKHCDRTEAPIVAQIYSQPHGESRRMESVCADCIVPMVREMSDNSVLRILVEVADSAARND